VKRAVAAVALAALIAGGAAAASGFRAPGSADALRSSAAGQPLAASSAVTAATAWCGTEAQTDRVPNAVAGDPIHWIYLIPSDGPDNLSSVASAMQSDAEQIDAWWRGQDATRTVRNDVATFSCGTQLDVTTVRSNRSGAQLTPISGRFVGIVDTLQRAGLTSSLTKYVLYYDGPIDDDNICGQGGSDRSDGTGFGVAVVYYRSCSGVSTAAVAAHEFLHTIGAVPDAAPNDCPGQDSGHTCDDENDIMYPAIGGEPLSAKVLDPGRNDYYGHVGGWLDTQDSAWLVRLDSQTPLGLSVAGTGTVTADVPGLQCSTTCTTTWNAGQPLVLIATPGPQSKLVRWGGSCSGSGTCSVSVTPGARVTALFAPATFRLTVSVSGQGTVRSSSGGITCRPRCAATLPSYSPVRLVAVAVKGWKLRGWSGACRGARKTCTVPMSAATSARAAFARR
jgi:Divergent InlB B-repeat domain